MYVIDQVTIPEDRDSILTYLRHRTARIKSLNESERGSLALPINSLNHASTRVAQLVSDINAHYGAIRVESVAGTRATINKYFEDAHKDIKSNKCHFGNVFTRILLGDGVDYVTSAEYRVGHSMKLHYSHHIHRCVTYPQMLLVVDLYAIRDSLHPDSIIGRPEYTLITPEGEVGLGDRLKLLDMCPGPTLAELLWVANVAIRPMNAS